jgi:hypothetical protein
MTIGLQNKKTGMRYQSSEIARRLRKPFRLLRFGSSQKLLTRLQMEFAHKAFSFPESNLEQRFFKTIQDVASAAPDGTRSGRLNGIDLSVVYFLFGGCFIPAQIRNVCWVVLTYGSCISVN